MIRKLSIILYSNFHKLQFVSLLIPNAKGLPKDNMKVLFRQVTCHNNTSIAALIAVTAGIGLIGSYPGLVKSGLRLQVQGLTLSTFTRCYTVVTGLSFLHALSSCSVSHLGQFEIAVRNRKSSSILFIFKKIFIDHIALCHLVTHSLLLWSNRSQYCAISDKLSGVSIVCP